MHRHMGIKYHNVREAVQNGEVDLTPIWTEHNVADIFTKSESRDMFLRFRPVLLGAQSIATMMLQHPKPVKDRAGCTLQYVQNQNSWPPVRLPDTPDSHEGEIMGITKVQIPGYDTQLMSLDPQF